MGKGKKYTKMFSDCEEINLLFKHFFSGFTIRMAVRFLSNVNFLADTPSFRFLFWNPTMNHRNDTVSSPVVGA